MHAQSTVHLATGAHAHSLLLSHRPLCVWQHKRYLGQPIGAQPPHIFAVADRMYRLLVSGGESQAIIVSGPSGSGKTETCKYVLRHLAYVSKDTRSTLGSKSSQELGDLLVRTNPLLEAFGNAETVLNRNSSRFGKFVQVRSRRGVRHARRLLPRCCCHHWLPLELPRSQTAPSPPPRPPPKSTTFHSCTAAIWISGAGHRLSRGRHPWRVDTNILARDDTRGPARSQRVQLPHQLPTGAWLIERRKGALPGG